MKTFVLVYVTFFCSGLLIAQNTAPAGRLDMDQGLHQLGFLDFMFLLSWEG